MRRRFSRLQGPVTRLGMERLESRCVLSAGGMLAPSFQIRLETVDLDGNPVSEVRVGSEFELRMLASDLRTTDDAGGLFAVFADIVYRESHVELSTFEDGGAIRFGKDYATYKWADISAPGVINEVGALGGLTPVGVGEVLVASFRFIAKDLGTARFGLDAADDTMQHDLLAYGLSHSVASATVHQATTMRIVDTNGVEAPDDGWTPNEDTIACSPAIACGDVPTPDPKTTPSTSVDPIPHAPQNVSALEPYDFLISGKLPVDSEDTIRIRTTWEPAASDFGSGGNDLLIVDIGLQGVDLSAAMVLRSSIPATSSYTIVVVSPIAPSAPELPAAAGPSALQTQADAESSKASLPVDLQPGEPAALPIPTGHVASNRVADLWSNLRWDLVADWLESEGIGIWAR